MRHKHAGALCMLTIILSLVAAPHVVRAQNRSRPNHQLTIYVDEGRGQLNGHVFFGLSDGRTTIYQGWHSLDKLLAPLALGGGQVWNDAPLAECGWDVKKTYDISPAGYERARRGVVEWNTEGRAWAINHHCGDFVETIAQMAGAPIKLPGRATGRNRPELFGDYLRSQGGELSGETFYVNGPVDTRTSVKRGDKIRVRASGLVIFGRLWAGGGGPAGVNNPFIGPEYNRFGNVPHGGLLARVRSAGSGRLDDWSYVGGDGEFISQAAGVLELDVNDTEPENNEGKFEVVINICRAP